jgi:hypothetical protein
VNFKRTYRVCREKGLQVRRKRREKLNVPRRALLARDRGCTLPGCHRAHYLDGHRLRHWIDGGETSPDNVTLLCTYHHRLLHEGAFHTERAADGVVTFMRTDGRVIPRFGYRAEDFRDDDVSGDAPHVMDFHGA